MVLCLLQAMCHAGRGKHERGGGNPPPRRRPADWESYYGTLTLVASPVLVIVKVPAEVLGV